MCQARTSQNGSTGNDGGPRNKKEAEPFVPTLGTTNEVEVGPELEQEDEEETALTRTKYQRRLSKALCSPVQC